MRAIILAVVAAGCSSSLQSNDGGGGSGGGSTGVGGTTGGTGALGGRCGGSSNAVCGQGQGCLWECFGDTLTGECVALPAACDELLKPVCGCDGVTYGNECLLQRVAVRKDHDGACVFTTTPTPIAGDAALLTGIWSGAGIRMDVNETGATISAGCAHGTIDQPLTVSRYSYTVAGPLPRRGSWLGTLSGPDGGATAGVTYQALLTNTILELRVQPDQFWSMQHKDVGAPPCP